MPASHEEVAELLGAYALHAVDPDERSLVEEHLRDCPRCQAELRDHEGVATLLANGGGDAPPGVWDRIAATLEEAPPPMRLPLGERPRTGGRRLGPRAGWLLAAAAAAVIAVLGLQVVQQDDRIDTLQAALQDASLTRAANRAMSTPGADVAELTSPDGSLQASAVLLPDGSGYLLAHGLPGLDRDRTYQLWGQTDAGLLSLGLLGSHPTDVVAFHAGAPVRSLAITDEEAPGVVQSRNAPVVAGSLA
jgi:anti-sigma factor RsiW